MTVHGSVAVLTYHSIAAETTSTFADLTVDPSLFAEHVAALGEHELEVIAFDDVPHALSAGRRAVSITIDDGLADVAEHACPTLADAGLPATLFVPSGYLDAESRWLRGDDGRRPMLSSIAVSELADQGFEIGSHGRRHLAADVNSGERVFRDALDSRLELEDRIGRPVRSFAYPFGYHSAAGRRAVRAAGYGQACAVGDLPARDDDDRFALPRLQVKPQMSADQLLSMVDRRLRAGERGWAHAKQSAWRLGRHWAGWGPAEARRIRTVAR